MDTILSCVTYFSLKCTIKILEKLWAEIFRESVKGDPSLRSAFMLASLSSVCWLIGGNSFLQDLWQKFRCGCKDAPLVVRAWRNIGVLYDTQLQVQLRLCLWPEQNPIHHSYDLFCDNQNSPRGWNTIHLGFRLYCLCTLLLRNWRTYIKHFNTYRQRIFHGCVLFVCLRIVK